jgi:cell division protein FtsQ
LTPVALSKDRRFRRSHVKPARRRSRWRPAVWRLVRVALGTAAVAYLVYRGGAAVASTRMLQVDRIVVRGNDRLSHQDVAALLNGLIGENLVLCDLDRWRQQLLSSPWVRDAAFRRTLPSTVEVMLAERIPIGIGRIGNELFLVDERGSVMDEYGPQYADLDLPIIDGLVLRKGTDAVADPARAELAAQIIRGLGERPAVAANLSQLDVTDVRNAAVILKTDPARLYVGTERFGPRLQSYLDLAATVRERVPNIDYVDLRFEGRIYVRPEGAGRTRPVRLERP